MLPHVPAASPDPDADLLANLRDLLPAAFPDGELDASALLAALSLAEPSKPSFTFAWPGLEEARASARCATSATLVPDVSASLNWETARNILIEGDNLQVLKLLKAGYAREAKLIYIDPPYNTGETFVYKDDFSIAERVYLKATGQIDEQGNVTTSKIEKAGRKHAPWLSFMFPRLAVARHLLRRDGAILVSIDDNEVHHLRLLLDSIFGSNNFIGCFVWQGGRKNDARRISVGHDYIIAYARDLAYLKDNDIRWREKKSGLEEIYRIVEELRAQHGQDFKAIRVDLAAWYKNLPEDHLSKQHDHFAYVDERGVYFPDNLRSPNPRENLVYNFKGYEPHPNGWAYSRERMEQLDSEDRLHYPAKADQRLKIKSYLHEHEEWAPGSVFYKDRRAASKALAALMGAEVFDYPKDTDVLARLFQAITDENDLIIDFFAGSGSTGHAVWQQNQADGKRRRWILAQVPEVPDTTEDSGKAAVAAGYATIFELAKDRLARCAGPLSADGFRVFRAAESKLIIEEPLPASENMSGEDYIFQSLKRASGAPIVEGADPAAVAWEIALKATRTQLDACVVEHDISGVRTFAFTAAGAPASHGRLLISLDAFTLATADALGLSTEDTVVLRGDKVADSTTLTLAARLGSRLIMLERTPREVSL